MKERLSSGEAIIVECVEVQPDNAEQIAEWAETSILQLVRGEWLVLAHTDGCAVLEPGDVLGKFDDGSVGRVDAGCLLNPPPGYVYRRVSPTT